METLQQIYAHVESWGIHRYGWLFVAAVLVIPALVSGNMLQFYLTKVLRGETSAVTLVKPIVGNFLVVIVCATIIATALYLHF